MNGVLLKSGKSVKNLVVLDTGSVRTAECEEFAKIFPDRYFGFGLAESNILSVAAGFAIAGKLPIVFGSARFLLSAAFDQVYYDICLPNLNVKIVGIGEGGVDQELIKILPNMKAVSGGFERMEQVLKEYGPTYLHF